MKTLGAWWTSVVVATCVSGCGPSVLVRYQTRPLLDLGDVSALAIHVQPGTSRLGPAAASELTRRLAEKTVADGWYRLTPCEPGACAADVGVVEVEVLQVEVAMREVVQAPVTVSATSGFSAATGTSGASGFAPGPGHARMSTTTLLRAMVHLGVGQTSATLAREYRILKEGSTTNVSDAPEVVLRTATEDLATAITFDLEPQQRYERITLDAEGPLADGARLAQQGQLQRAKAAFEAVLTADPGSVGAAFDLGVVDEGLADFEGARAAYRVALERSHGAERFRRAITSIDEHLKPTAQ